MDRNRYDIVLKFLEGKLSGQALADFESEVRRSSKLQQEVDQLRILRQQLKDTIIADSTDATKPFLTDRIMRTLDLEAGRETVSFSEDLFINLTQVFRPVMVTTFLMALLLGLYNYNLSTAYETEISPTEAILAIPPVSSASVYALDYFDTPIVEEQ